MLARSEELATTTQLLAGVAHELTNALAVVISHSYVLAEEMSDTPAAEQALTITKAAKRCGRIVRSLVTLARPHPGERQRLSLNEVIEEAVELWTSPFKVAGVEVRLDLATDLPDLWADPHQLHQLLATLITNAHHAMRDTPPPRRLMLGTHADASRGCVCLRVGDTGPGVPAEIRQRIFEPRFTTKPLGEGTGAGLPLCRSIVTECGGTLRLETPSDDGAVFVIELPATTRAPDAV